MKSVETDAKKANSGPSKACTSSTTTVICRQIETVMIQFQAFEMAANGSFIILWYSWKITQRLHSIVVDQNGISTSRL